MRSEFAPVPVETRPFYEVLLESVDRSIRRDPDGVAFVSAERPDDSISWRELADKCGRLASFLSARRQFGHGQICCVVLPNCWQYAVAFVAATMTGGAVSGASAMFTDYELQRQFLDSQASVVLTDQAHLPRVLHAAADCPKITTVICVTDEDDAARLPAKVFSFKEATSSRGNALFRPDSRRYSPDDLLLLPYSSGTTGSPKGVMLTHQNFGTMSSVILSHFQKQVYPHTLGKEDAQSENFLILLPVYHIYGFGLLMRCILEGMTGVIFSKFDPALFCQKIQDYKVKQIYIVPPIVILLAKHPMVSKFDLRSVQLVLSAAAPCGKDIIVELLARHKNIKFFGQGYGMTECGMASHIAVASGRTEFLAVKLLSNFEQKIVNVKTGAECATGQPGEIWVRGPTVMKGYLNRREATAEAIDDDGWLHTGDIGFLDDEGYLFVVDRLKELIKVKGLQVPPAELEDILLSHPKVQDAAVIGIPDARSGEVPKAFVVRADASVTGEQIQAFVKSKVSAYKQLAGGVEFLAEIPKAPSGKILRRFLREREFAKSKM